jgi:hypothetical protein
MFINFFTNLSSFINIVYTSCNRFEELQIAQTTEIVYLIEIDEIERRVEGNLVKLVLSNGMEIFVGVLT